jgi:hypothetical protein
METTTETPEVKTTSKNYHKTMDESISAMKLTFGNALLPEIFSVMQTVGYTREKINSCMAMVTEVEQLSQARIKEFADQTDEQKKFDEKRAEIAKTFTTHRSLVRIQLKKDVHARVSLQLEGEIPYAYDAWMQMQQNFYGQLGSQSDLLAKTATVGVNEAAITTQKQSLADLQALKESLKKETAEAQAATDARDRAFDEVYPLYSEYIKYAKILLAGNQALEAIGVTVK